MSVSVSHVKRMLWPKLSTDIVYKRKRERARIYHRPFKSQTSPSMQQSPNQMYFLWIEFHSFYRSKHHKIKWDKEFSLVKFKHTRNVMRVIHISIWSGSLTRHVFGKNVFGFSKLTYFFTPNEYLKIHEHTHEQRGKKSFDGVILLSLALFIYTILPQLKHHVQIGWNGR